MADNLSEAKLYIRIRELQDIIYHMLPIAKDYLFHLSRNVRKDLLSRSEIYTEYKDVVNKAEKLLEDNLKY